MGIGLQLGADGASMGVTVSAAAGKGKGAGNSTTYTNTNIGGETVCIESSGDTALKGAVVQCERVVVNVGGNLTIESLQDSSRYQESSKTACFSTSAPITGGNVGASVSAGKTKVQSDFKSVTEQSAIRAQDGGFQVSVAGDTTLTGGAITVRTKPCGRGATASAPQAN